MMAIPPPVSPGQTVLRDGLSAATAAASCWDIKQRDPNSQDGTYWLQTPAMDAPAQFFCDQTTDGGGWVMIGRGREGWESWSGGKGDPAKLTSRSRTADDFEVVQLSNKAVTELLNNEPVKDQADGVRVMRSWSASGRSYQTMDLQFPKMSDFVWPFKMAHPVSVSMDGASPVSGLLWNTLGYDQGWNALQLYPSARTGWTVGWGYGIGAGNWGGDLSSASSFFHKNGQTVFPYSEAYVRPRIASDSSAFTRIPDEGEAGFTVTRAVSNYAATTSWGVPGTPTAPTRKDPFRSRPSSRSAPPCTSAVTSPASSRARTVPRTRRAAWRPRRQYGRLDRPGFRLQQSGQGPPAPARRSPPRGRRLHARQRRDSCRHRRH